MSQINQRKLDIIETAMKLFRENGVDKTTIVEICEALGITRSSFYYHFASKEEILDNYFLTTELQIDEHLIPILSTDSSYLQFTKIFALYMERTAEWGPNIFSHIINRFMDGKNQLLSPEDIKMKDVYINLISQAQVKGEIANQAPADELTEIIVHLATGIAVYWCNEKGSFNYSDRLKETIESFLCVPNK